MPRLPLSAAALAGFVALLGAPSLAQAEERLCRGSLGKVTVDNLRVPPGATCRLDGTRVKGTIQVERAATLTAARIVVIGDLKADNHRQVNVGAGSRIGGSVQIEKGGPATITNSTIDGSIELKANVGALRVLANRVEADVQAFANRRGVEIADNRIDGNLQCKSNNPAPLGGRNTVQGTKEDQCRRL